LRLNATRAKLVCGYSITKNTARMRVGVGYLGVSSRPRGIKSDLAIAISFQRMRGDTSCVSELCKSACTSCTYRRPQDAPARQALKITVRNARAIKTQLWVAGKHPAVSRYPIPVISTYRICLYEK